MAPTLQMQLALVLGMVLRDAPRALDHARSARQPFVAADDEELVRRIGRGDRWAEEALYRRYVGTVYSTARRLLGNTVDAEDVVQDTFACAFEIWDQLRDPGRVKHWLLQIAVRKVHRRFRRRKLLRALGLDRSVDDATLESMARVDATAEARTELALLDVALRRLSPFERIAWMLRFVEGMKLEEVAQDCGCSLATAKRRIAAAQAKVDAHVQLQEASDA